MGKRARWIFPAAAIGILVIAACVGIAAQDKPYDGVALQEAKPAWQDAQEEYVSGEYLVRFQEERVAKGEAVRALEDSGMEVVKVIAFKPSKAFPNGLKLYHVKARPGIAAENAARSLESRGDIKYIQPNRRIYADQVVTDGTVPNDPRFGDLWSLSNTGQEFMPGLHGLEDCDIDAIEAWDVRHDAPTIIVADIDADIQVDHPDLVQNIWVNEDEIPGNGIDDDGNGYVDDVNGWDFCHDDNTIYDGESDHGTHTAGTVGAVGNNGIGVAGVAWNVRIMALKFIGPNGGDLADAVEAFAYAANNGAHLTTNSWGYTGAPDPALQDAIAASGMIAVCAAGNTASDNDARPTSSHYPSSYPLENIIAVAASDWNDELAYFTCIGATTVDLAAPGHRVLSTVPTDHYVDPYAYFSGTSMATPHVAGAVALLLAQYPDMPHFPGDEGFEEGDMTIKDLLLATVDRKPAFEGKVLTGGRLNLRNALLNLVPPVIDSVSATPVSGMPPLQVSFTASAYAAHDGGTIADAWWDFGDGSAPAHGYNATHTYQTVGTYAAMFHAVDDRGIEASAQVRVVVFDESYVILVDDDDRLPYHEAFTRALDAAGVPWVVLQPPMPLPSTISNPVIWTTGRATKNTLTAADQSWLAAYLDNGGRLFVSGQDIIYNVGTENSFVRNYLHVASAKNDVTTTRVYGVPGEPLTEGREIELNYPFIDRSDSIIPDQAAAPIFTNDQGFPCALRYVGPNGSRVVFLAFPFEAIPGEEAEGTSTPGGVAAEVMAAICEFLFEDGQPEVSAAPGSFDVTLPHGTTTQETLRITNNGDAVLYFNVSTARVAPAGLRPLAAHVGSPKGAVQAEGIAQTDNSGGPDGYGYVWKDSDDPDGPVFDWVDITEVGELAVIGDDVYKQVTLPFEFPFYGQIKTKVLISSNGYLSFGLDGTDYDNDPVPDGNDPNDLLAVFWDDLNTVDGGVYYYYDASNNRFIVSWVNVRWHDEETIPQGSLTFQAILYPDGRIKYQYAGMNATLTGATVGIENSFGTQGLQVVYDGDYVHDNLAVEFTCRPDGLTFDPQFMGLEPGESVDVTVGFDARLLDEGTYDRQIVITTNDPDNQVVTVPATITVSANQLPVISRISVTPTSGEPPLAVSFSAEVDSTDGSIADTWWDFGDGTQAQHASSATHVYTAMGRYIATFHVVDDVGAEATANVAIDVATMARASVSPGNVRVSAVPGSVVTRQLQVINEGTRPLRFTVTAFTETEPLMLVESTNAESVDGNATNAAGIFEPMSQPIRQLDFGDAVKSWPIDGVYFPWGVGFDGEHVWISSVKDHDYEFTVDGVPTGFGFDTPWTSGWPADMAWDGRYIWQVDVGSDNGIYALDPATGDVVNEIHDPDGIWDATSQRGLAYDPAEDVFFIGGWNQRILYKIAGLSWAEPGKILRIYDEHRLPIAGMARVGRYLVLALNNHPDLVAVMDSTTGNLVTWFQHPGGGSLDAYGCEADSEGNVWMVYGDGRAYLVDFDSLFGGIPSWLGIEPREGVAAPGGAASVDLTFDTSGLKYGVNYSCHIAVMSNASDNPTILVPVTFRLNRQPVVNVTSPVGGETWVGMHEITWSAEDPDNEEESLAIKLEYSGDRGATWNLIAQGESNDGSYLWDTSEVGKGGVYLVRVTATDPDGGAGSGVSGEFTIVAIGDGVIAAPNPASDYVTFYHNLAENATLYVYDIAGRLVYTVELAATSFGEPGTVEARNGGYAPAEGVYVWNLTNVNGEPLANGLYLYLVVTDSGEKSGVKRLVISR